MRPITNNQNALRLAAFILALSMAAPALAVSPPQASVEALPLPEAPVDIEPHHHDHAEPMTTSIRFVGDPEGTWAIELTGHSEWPAQRTSIEAWSPDGRARLATGEEALRGRNLTTGDVWESFRFDALTDPVAQVRISIEVDGGDSYGLNNDYHLRFYRILDDPGNLKAAQEHSSLAELVQTALREAGEETELPRDADSFHAWGPYGVAIDDMAGRCCNASAMPDPPFSNGVPATFLESDGQTPPNLPPAIHTAVELEGATAAFEAGEVRPTRSIDGTLNGTPAPVPDSAGEILFKHPVTGLLVSLSEAQSARSGDTSGGTASGSTGGGGTSGGGTSGGSSGRYVTITGRILLVSDMPCMYCIMDIYESDGSQPHDYLGGTYADRYGYFSVNGWVGDGEAAIDPYVQVGLHGAGRVTSANENGATYFYNPGQAHPGTLNCSSSTCSMGTLVLNQGDSTGSYGYEELDRDDWDGGAISYYWATVAFDRLADTGYSYRYPGVSIRSPIDKSIDPTHNEENGVYHPGVHEIHLSEARYKARSIIAHELGHYVMADIYGEFINYYCGDSHAVWASSNEACAWGEGWGDFWAVHGLFGVTGDRRFIFHTGAWWDIENLDKNFAASFDEGVDVEGRVAMTLWDLVDGGNDGETVNYATHTELVPIMENTPQTSLKQLYDRWSLRYGALMSDDFRIVAKHNTIDTTGW